MKNTDNLSTNSALATYAMRPELSRGRKYPEEEHPYRSVFQRDRDRIIHSHAFRRLQYKTQVFVNHEGDQFRTRLTHTLEVVQIARTIAKALRLNEELVEAIALAHDIGHTPFGHAGEDILREIMKDQGGFDHNLQGLRVVDILEERYPNFKGLNLTWEVREGIIKHITAFDNPHVLQEFDPNKMPTLEAQVVNIADEIAFYNHDLDDGITSGLLKENELEKIELWRIAREKISRQYTDLKPNIEKYQIIRTLIDLQVSALVEESQKKISEAAIEYPDAVFVQKEKTIGFHQSPLKGQLEELSDFLFNKLYRHYKVVRMSSKAQRFLRELFEVYLANPEQLPPGTARKDSKQTLYRDICDYISGMTDRYALDEYKKLFHPWERV
ncbi:MAG: deoxyguanosinetriphosphate triphosphohydrolase [Candidatus Omnitrophica bacterium]|nr:deoxyguanosinetriphosphate triphosphohydrolase [Candidatus Omnitrophota bacterium]MBU4478912.1 deoxyguanosinetriphosphate triphosphohydrolase [Candidatus Omnitrophota bacterium]MCG2704373.1 deoxyguanosinetriphosphate triphosphohydrolase [Candidatus Omnitrophota bacterium]